MSTGRCKQSLVKYGLELSDGEDDVFLTQEELARANKPKYVPPHRRKLINPDDENNNREQRELIALEQLRREYNLPNLINQDRYVSSTNSDY